MGHSLASRTAARLKAISGSSGDNDAAMLWRDIISCCIIVKQYLTCFKWCKARSGRDTGDIIYALARSIESQKPI